MRRISGFLVAAILTSAIGCSPSDRLLLRHKFRKGQVLRYRLQIAEHRQVSGKGSEQQLERQSDIIIAVNVLDTMPAGDDPERTWARLRVKLESGNTTVMRNIQQTSADVASLPGADRAALLIVDDLGRLVKVEQPAAVILLGGDSMDLTGFFGNTSFPHKGQRAGDAWMHRVPLRLPGTDPRKDAITTSMRLVELTEKDGHKCAKIRYTVEGPPESTPRKGVGVTIQLSGEGESYFDYEAGVEVEAEQKMVITATHGMTLPSGGRQEIQSISSSEVSMRLVSDAAPQAAPRQSDF